MFHVKLVASRPGVHDDQLLQLFNGHHDNCGAQTVVVLGGDGRFAAAVLRPAKRTSDLEIWADRGWIPAMRSINGRLAEGHRRRLLRANWPKTPILTGLYA